MRDTARRAVHFVGSFPATDTEDAMRAMLSGAGARLCTLATGEVRRYETYLQVIIADLVAQGILEVRSQGSWETSSERTLYRVAPGAELTGDAMNLGYLDEAREALPIYRRLRAEQDRPDLLLQIGMPTDFTLAFIALGARGVRRYRRAFADAMTRDIAAIRELAGDDVVFQLEATAEMVALSKVPSLQRAVEFAFGLGRGMAAVAAASPLGTRFGVHLCVGSMNNKARAILPNAKPLVTLANSVVRHWPADRPLEFVHGPLAAGDIPPSPDPHFYTPLRDLALGPDTAFYAGIVHEDPTEEEQIHLLHLAEQGLGRRADGVASACGLGRRPRPIADELVARAARLADAP
ncbi:hypothetical protein [Nocardia pseudobrasiliensis]|uniref:Uncharacterized protein n=1 Tax=Nocardia pseudobrasiliensis TaxID=45979 RepID=A0A370I620_9NOCA|nr:hypothetical protein [Nocardia pseudobrasiliensis]RDI64764.1 hypothetical protein DFR76_107140 [Nocardia pseudobrasiliensis]